MLRGSRWLALASVVVLAALVGPTAALADGCNDGSATSIYTECVQQADGGKKHHPTSKAPPTQPSQPSQTTTPPPVVPPTVHVTTSHKPHAHNQGAGTGQNRIRNHPAGSQRLKDPVLASSPTGQSKLGSAFDLGTGPTLLFALLAGTVLLLLGTGGVRSWRNRHRV